MHLSLSFWCALLSYTQAQQTSSTESTSRTSSAIPWITYTSTRSCTTQPSTVFVYTSNSSTFLLPHPGPNSALTPLGTERPSVDSSYSDVDDSSSDHISSESVADSSESDRTSEEASSNTQFGQGGLESGPAYATQPLEAPSESVPGNQITAFEPSPTDQPTSSTSTSRRGLGAGFNPGSGPRSGTDDSSSISTPSTSGLSDSHQISAYLSSSTSRRGLGAGFNPGSEPRSGTESSTIAFGESPTTSAIPQLEESSSTCPLPSTVTIFATLPSASHGGVLEKTVTSYITNSCPLPGEGFDVTHSTIYRTSLVERTATAISTLPFFATITFTQLEDGSTIYRTSLIEIAPSQALPEPSTATIKLVESGVIVHHTTTVERSAAPEFVTLTFTEAQDGSTVYRTSVVERTVFPTDLEPSTITYTTGIDATGDLTVSSASGFSIIASTFYSCISDAEQESRGPANASVPTVTSTMYETLNAPECPANFSISTVISFVYGSDAVSNPQAVYLSLLLRLLPQFQGQRRPLRYGC